MPGMPQGRKVLLVLAVSGRDPGIGPATLRSGPAALIQRRPD